MLSKVTKSLDEASDPNLMNLCTSGEDETNSPIEGALSDEELSGEESVGGWSPQSPQHQPFSNIGGISSHSGLSTSDRALNRRIRRDLRSAKDAGFRVGHLGSLFTPGHETFVIISCRIAKFGISQEALQAWQLSPSQYFVLLIRYSEGYRTLEQLIDGVPRGQTTVNIRVGVSCRHRIGISDAIRAFIETKDKGKEEDSLENEPSNPTTGLNSFFLSRSLDELMNDRLIRLLRYRINQAFSWEGAEKYYNDHQGRKHSSSDEIAPEYWKEEAGVAEILPDLVTSDHLKQKSNAFSFPLLAMQFALRHLVRCTEFCLVCHCKVEEDFEALKPYVCSRSLCLYQYIGLGFGPSIEHEIISQPDVVDLLISFCYTSAYEQNLKTFPLGMALIVPSLSLIPTIRPSGSRLDIPQTYPVNPTLPRFEAENSTSSFHEASGAAAPSVQPVIYKARLDQLNKELILSPNDRGIPRVGQWLFVNLCGSSGERWHCRVIDTLHPTVRLGTPINLGRYIYPDGRSARTVLSAQPQHQVGGTKGQIQDTALAGPTLGAVSKHAGTSPDLPAPLSTRLVDVEFIIYDQIFDDLTHEQKQTAICILLETLPSVAEMRTFLQSHNGRMKSLQAWTDRISPAALGVLRWIIASNRSCIIQVDDQEGDTPKAEERVSGMPDWMQFRFAQGAPDREQRFVRSVRETSEHLKYPTLFAWHGSPLRNWHDILREGLHFRKVQHGRAYGHGVYHALEVSTSLGYSSGSHRTFTWPQSGLQISAAVALNEVVNDPNSFISKHPHLVIAQLDWIQSRYLFVKCNKSDLKIRDTPPTQIYAQDPTWSPMGFPPGHKIQIPVTAVSKSRRPMSNMARSGHKRVKIGMDTPESEFDEGQFYSDETDSEDRTVLSSEDDEILPETTSDMAGGKAGASAFKRPSDPTGTDFVPGTLDHSSLKLLEAPSYATPFATKCLQRELKSILQVQENTPLQELGWYIDSNLITNVYQWIIELHSFDNDLPLAMDMKMKGLTSIVIEIRFGKDYPISPPFVRVIRPRFLNFMAGGGGHVTSGGALCMELLTNSGWSAVTNVESILLQVRLAISSTEPKPARLEPGQAKEYGVMEAVEAFIRACRTHNVSSY